SGDRLQDSNRTLRTCRPHHSSAPRGRTLRPHHILVPPFILNALLQRLGACTRLALLRLLREGVLTRLEMPLFPLELQIALQPILWDRALGHGSLHRTPRLGIVPAILEETVNGARFDIV